MDNNPPTIRSRQFFHTPKWHFVLSTPFIYAVLFPMLLLDLMVEIYHHVCFPLYGLKLVNRKKYFFFDRDNLPKLNFVEKINCHYCGYANGFAAYFLAIAGETEAYWCAIKHQKRISFSAQPHTAEFLEREKFQ